jgi:hypothetical protein
LGVELNQKGQEFGDLRPLLYDCDDYIVALDHTERWLAKLVLDQHVEQAQRLHKVYVAVQDRVKVISQTWLVVVELFLLEELFVELASGLHCFLLLFCEKLRLRLIQALST